VILGSRDPNKGQQAVSDLVQSIGGNCQERLEVMVLDTSSDESVRMAAQSFERKYGHSSLYGIINNAAVRNFVLPSFISLDDAVRSFTRESLSHLDDRFLILMSFVILPSINANRSVWEIR
jgi:NAD(P)-dependent dehydrogenase (short-subunit alcohol dehydrogenase family)